MTIQPPPPKPRRRGRPLTVLIIALIVLVCLVVAADRIGERVAEDQVGARLQERIGTAERPKVEVAEVPFLTQLVAQRFGRVNLSAEQIPVTGASASGTLDRLDLALDDVRIGDRQLTAGTVNGTAFADYASLSSLGGAEIRYVPEGRVTIDFTAPVGGQTVSGTLTGRPVIESGRLSLIEPQLKVGGVDLPQTLVDVLLSSLLRSFTLPQLPFDLALTAVTARESGLEFGLAGRDISIAR
ncbi:LmeA family phospholipid-binding protein [Microlunatus parietis]|uniref:DUF2993 domain-containing protein n=1 Tax=Microlunatus parietis TaxID=682979 RepID=A0A7Y9ICF7_9ACTN|nr:DUF2993 domain-containing protein [Microlunatus parietis]NYE74366.1 hypothetical protein [Microlunatus parietis]